MTDIISLSQESSLDDIRNGLKSIPYVDVYVQNLGGIPSIFIQLSLDEKNSWNNGIFHNSRHAIFAIHEDMKLELIAKSYQVSKLRKSKIQTIDNILSKILQWAEKNNSI